MKERKFRFEFLDKEMQKTYYKLEPHFYVYDMIGCSVLQICSTTGIIPALFPASLASTAFSDWIFRIATDLFLADRRYNITVERRRFIFVSKKRGKRDPYCVPYRSQNWILCSRCLITERAKSLLRPSIIRLLIKAISEALPGTRDVHIIVCRTAARPPQRFL